MKDRILAFLQSENKSYAQFAEEIGVQPSGISHILSGRNNPSLDFVIKMLQKYPSLSAEWLLFGRGSMQRYASQPTLFDVEPQISRPEAVSNETVSNTYSAGSNATEGQEMASEEHLLPEEHSGDLQKRLTRVLFFYSDKTFREYRPS